MNQRPRKSSHGLMEWRAGAAHLCSTGEKFSNWPIFLLRPRPVSVSLEICIESLNNQWDNYRDSEDRVINYCKAVLDATGVTYGD